MSWPRVAYLCSQDTLPACPNRRIDAWEHDLTIGALGMGLAEIARTIEPVRWDDAHVRWTDFEAVVIGTTWDYAPRLTEFLSVLEHIAKTTLVLNSPAVVRWNSDKTYLRELGAAGVPVVPTVWLPHAEEHACRAAFATFGCTALVIKPQVGAGAWRQIKLGCDDPWPSDNVLPPGPTMVQPYLPTIATVGETSMVFFGGQFSHAVVKRPRSGDYRIQSAYGGTDQPVQPTAAELAAAHRALAAVPSPTPLLYARVDLLAGPDGDALLMELEAIEPYLYPVHAPMMGRTFAAAYRTALAL